MLRRAAALLAVTSATTFAWAVTASAAEPIVGYWQDVGADKVTEYFETTDAKSFGARLASGQKPGGPCPDAKSNLKVSGSGLSYSGTISYYNGSCQHVGDGSVEITLSADRNTMTFRTSPPSGCCAATYESKRVPRPAQPIEGRWKLLDGLIDFLPDNEGGYKATVVTPPNKACPAAGLTVALQGSGASYSGTLQAPETDGCRALPGDGSVKIDMAADNLSAHLVAGATDTTITRVDTLKTLTLQGKLAMIVNDILVGFQKQYRTLQGAAKKRQVGLLRALARAADKGRKTVEDYKPVAPEKTLHKCALAGIAQVHKASARGSKKTAPGAGMRTIAKCLKPFSTTLPFEQPGREAQKLPKPGEPGVPLPISKLGAYVSRVNRFNGTRVTRFDFLVKDRLITAVEMAIIGGCGEVIVIKYPDSVLLSTGIDSGGFFKYDGYVAGYKIHYQGRVLGPMAVGHVQADFSYPGPPRAYTCSTGIGKFSASLYTNPADFRMFGPPGIAGTPG